MHITQLFTSIVYLTTWHGKVLTSYNFQQNDLHLGPTCEIIHDQYAVLVIWISSNARDPRYAELAYTAWGSFDVIDVLLQGRRITRDLEFMSIT